jgi:hypothetical protein
MELLQTPMELPHQCAWCGRVQDGPGAGMTFATSTRGDAFVLDRLAGFSHVCCLSCDVVQRSIYRRKRVLPVSAQGAIVSLSERLPRAV